MERRLRHRTLTCVVLQILRPYPVLTLLVPFYIRHEAKIVNFKVTTVLYYILYCYRYCAESEGDPSTGLHRIVQCWEKRGNKKKKKRPVRTTSFLYKAAHESVISAGNGPPELFAVVCFLISLGTKSGLFFSRAALTDSGW